MELRATGERIRKQVTGHPGGADPSGGADRGPGQRGRGEPADRRPAVREPEHGRVPPRQRLPEARCHLPHPARPPREQPGHRRRRAGPSARTTEHRPEVPVRRRRPPARPGAGRSENGPRTVDFADSRCRRPPSVEDMGTASRTRRPRPGVGRLGPGSAPSASFTNHQHKGASHVQVDLNLPALAGDPRHRHRCRLRGLAGRHRRGLRHHVRRLRVHGLGHGRVRAFTSRNAGPVFGYLLLSLLSLAAGVGALVWPGVTALFLTLWVGAWAFVTGSSR